MPGLNEVWALIPEFSQFNVRFWHKADVKDDSIGKLPDAASAAWRRQLKLNGVLRANGAVARRSRLLF
ncbi:hypothetical protein ACXEIJ_004878 [Klebsiella quasipneumoniae]